ncbi:MAG: PEP-CTERM sorting domain-containing protein [Planctomycetia bacterium]
MISRVSHAVLLLGLSTAVTPALADPIDFLDFTQESYNFRPANSIEPSQWTVRPDGSAVSQMRNGQPTMFHGDFNAIGTRINVTVTTPGFGPSNDENMTSRDNDFLGFAFGWNENDATNAAANYLLVDWKQATEGYSLAQSPANTIGTAGLAVSKVTGVPTHEEFWTHTGDVDELTRGANFGSTGWAYDTSYDVTFEYTADMLRMWIDGVLEFEIAGSFTNGSFALYNFSQEWVTYSNASVEPVPEPASLALWTGGLLAVGALRRRRRRRRLAV